MRRSVWIVVSVALVAAACSGSGASETTTSVPETVTSTTTTTVAPSTTTSTTTTSTTMAPPPPGSGRFEEPERLVVLGTLELAPSVTDVWGYVDPTGREYAIVGSRIAGTSRGSVYIVDVTDPVEPTLVSEVADVPALDLKTRDHYIYASDDRADAGVVIDISDPRAPVVVGAMPAAHNFYIDEAGHLFIARIAGQPVYSVANDPTLPEPTDVTVPGHHDSLVIGDRLYLFGGFDPTYVYDVSDRGAPRLLSVIEDRLVEYHHSGWPTEDGRYLFIADESALGTRSDITVWDLADPASPVLAGGYVHTGAAAHNIQVRGSYAFISHYGAGIVILDVSDPTDPRPVARHDPIPGVVEGWARSDYGTFGVYTGAPSGVVYASGSEGLTLLRFTPPSLPPPELE